MLHVPCLIGVGHSTDYGITSNYTQTYSAVTLDIGTKKLNHGPHQWCSGPRMVMQVEYDIPPFYGYYIRHVSCLTGVDHPTDHGMIPNYTPDILIC
jgi:hypothetical protein